MAEDPIGQIVSHYRIVGKLGAGALGFVKVDIFFDPLHSDPRFQELLKRINLAD